MAVKSASETCVGADPELMAALNIFYTYTFFLDDNRNDHYLTTERCVEDMEAGKQQGMHDGSS